MANNYQRREQHPRRHAAQLATSQPAATSQHGLVTPRENTRDDVLRRDLAELVIRPGTCYAQTGVLHDPYTGATIPFARGPQTSGAVQVDHLVSLADAWYKGARTWDPLRRRNFANDPRNLVAVASKSNFDKAFRDAASWLPPNVAFRCEFVARQVDVKAAYGLWVSVKERAAMAAVLDRC
ncbi:HNH endonuclease family protein [Mycolicibacterium mageritense]|uniref:HNH endonuclease family protein n=1 Tax=Mycolicibacterium mageritense TaxID=53462 RepID=UPI0022A885CA|nr:HNH endonuclease family protein [Mycolicibacterium mageritense]